MANKNVAALALLAVVVVAVLLAEAPVTEAACSPVQLSPCAPAIMSNKPPSGACCGRLRQQKPCLCGYLRNPTLKRYINSPGAKRVASTCKVSVRC
ncbi:non-specific lipid-transfer protein 2 [Spinacia oleracea]|uniref:Non-specific lipid-transfer protein 2 n=1 Tax=Spinacia oleracea TaxID=3562 RepID=A0A9R0HZB1_SPIOL|nr:non-specific lipid-transfer protein 2-like [Spinacia oleracea]